MEQVLPSPPLEVQRQRLASRSPVQQVLLVLQVLLAYQQEQVALALRELQELVPQHLQQLVAQRQNLCQELSREQRQLDWAWRSR